MMWLTDGRTDGRSADYDELETGLDNGDKYEYHCGNDTHDIAIGQLTMMNLDWS